MGIMSGSQPTNATGGDLLKQKYHLSGFCIACASRQLASGQACLVLDADSDLQRISHILTNTIACHQLVEGVTTLSHNE